MTSEQLIHILPRINASLNAVAACLLFAGFLFIRQGRIRRHKYAMVSAFLVSILFLISYLTYHTLRQMNDGIGHTRWQVDGLWRWTYYAVLISHVLLAALVPVLAIRTLWLAWRADFVRHRRWARFTWPIWMYVSITGVVVYVMIYEIHPVLLSG